jgi:GAF domain-containing protein
MAGKTDARLAVVADLAETHERLIERGLEAARQALGMDMAYVADTRHGRQAYVAVAGDGPSFGVLAGSSVALDGTYCQLLLEGKLARVIPDTTAEPLVRELPITARGRIGAYCGIPIVLSDGRVFGTFCCLSHGARATLDERDAQFMQVIGRLIAEQIEFEETRRRQRRLEHMQAGIGALTIALAARDGYTQEHSSAVVDLARAVGERLGLSLEELEDLGNVAVLHDIGKLGVPDAVLHKPGPLNAEEWVLMRRHPVVGAEIAAGIPALAHLAPAIRAEHERWDGKGYPDGLAGDAIPLASRIVLVCDAFHAMTSDRPYRLALPLSVALEEFERHAGRQFCPQSAVAALEVLSPPRRLAA